MKTTIISMVVVITIAAVAILFFAKPSLENNAPSDASQSTQDTQSSQTNSSDTLSGTENTEIPPKPVGFTTAEALADGFMTACSNADVNEMSSLYYGDMFDQIYERTANNLSRENFDLLIAEEMKVIERYELYKYGGEEMQSSVSPLYYVNYFHYGSARADTEFEESQVTDCATLRVYKTDGNYTDHMFACIDGNWYITD